MKLAQTSVFVVALFAIACGGSSSESPMPLEPKPHVDEQPPELVETDPAKAPDSDEPSNEPSNEPIDQSDAANY